MTTKVSINMREGGDLKLIARSLNVKQEAVIYGKAGEIITAETQYIYDPVDQTTYGIPAGVGAGEVIVSVAGGQLETDVSSPLSYPIVKFEQSSSSRFLDVNYNSIVNAVEAAIDGGVVEVSTGLHQENSNIVPTISATSKLEIKGDQKTASKINTNLDDVLIYLDGQVDIKNLTIKQDIDGTGRAISTSNTRQSTFNNLEGLELEGFRYGEWHRYSLWQSWKDIWYKGNTCGLRLARSDYQSDNSNPVAPGNWNIAPGWFNNVSHLDKVLFSGGEVGFYGATMCTSFNAVTAQGQKIANPSGNDVLPTGMRGVGVFLESGADVSRDGWNNYFTNYYSEFSDISLYLKNQRFTGISSMFTQGGQSGDRAESAIICDNSNVNAIGVVGQDWYDDVFKAVNGGTLTLQGTSGPLAGNKYSADATSTIRMRGNVDADKHLYYILSFPSTFLTYTLPEAVPVASVAEIRICAAQNGNQLRDGTARITRFDNVITPSVVWDGAAPLGVTILVTTGGIVTVEVTTSQTWVGYVSLQTIFGNEISSTRNELTGV